VQAGSPMEVDGEEDRESRLRLANSGGKREESAGPKGLGDGASPAPARQVPPWGPPRPAQVAHWPAEQ
jgi:hypothetical protein